MDGDVSSGPSDSIEDQERSTAPHLHGQEVSNGLTAHNPPPCHSTGGVGRRTSVLFKKAKNGAKLFRERDRALWNGKGAQEEHNFTGPNSSSTTPSTTPLSTPTKTPQKSPGPPLLSTQDLCSDPELQRMQTLESGESTSFCSCYCLYMLFRANCCLSGWL